MQNVMQNVMQKTPDKSKFKELLKKFRLLEIGNFLKVADRGGFEPPTP